MVVTAEYQLQETERNYMNRAKKNKNAGDTIFSINIVVNAWALLLHFEILHRITSKLLLRNSYRSMSQMKHCDYLSAPVEVSGQCFPITEYFLRLQRDLLSAEGLEPQLLGGNCSVRCPKLTIGRSLGQHSAAQAELQWHANHCGDNVPQLSHHCRQGPLA